MKGNAKQNTQSIVHQVKKEREEGKKRVTR
jgi:hypothetical protein